MMDNEQERDTHFQGFAKLLYDELGTLDTLAIQRWGDYTSFDIAAKKLIAQRAYDLAWEIYNLAPVTEWEWRMSDIPDLTEWPNPPQPSLEPASD